MGEVNNQLSLPVGFKDSDSFDSFIVGQNAHLCDYLLSLWKATDNKNESTWLTYLFADTGLGKSHLLYASGQLAEQMDKSSVYLNFAEKDQLCFDVLQGLEFYNLICLDNIERLQGSSEWQVAVFDLINRVKEHDQSFMLVTGNQPSRQLGLELPDLVSRLSWGTSFQLFSLTDEQRQQALIVKAQHRGLNMSKDVAKYLVTHWQRDMPALVASLAKLDEQSLQQQRKLTIPFVKSILDL